MGLFFPFVIFVVSIGMLMWLSRGPFFVPTKRTHLPRMSGLLNIKPGDKIADLGSGDGRLLVAFAEEGGEMWGFEHNPLLVWRSKRNARKSGLSNQIHISRENFWHVDMSPFNAVVIYGIPYIMPNLEKKLLSELKPGARVVSNSFKFPNWPVSAEDRGVYLYIKPK